MYKLGIKRKYVLLFMGIMYLSFLFNLFGVIGLSHVTVENRDPNSMYPQYHQGDKLIILKVGPGKINQGDIIIYSNLDLDIVHRVQDVRVIDGKYFYRMKGDNYNNSVLDVNFEMGGTLVSYEQVTGKVIGSFDQGFGTFLYALSNPIYFTVFTISVLLSSYIFTLFVRQFDIRLSDINILPVNRRRVFLGLGLIFLLFSVFSATQYSIVIGKDNLMGDPIISTQINAFDNINDTLIIYTYYLIDLDLRLEHMVAGHYELNISLLQVNTVLAQMLWETRKNTFGDTSLSFALVINNENLPDVDTNLTLVIELQIKLLSMTKSQYKTVEYGVSFYTP